MGGAPGGGGDGGLAQLRHEGQVLLIHPRAVLGRLGLPCPRGEGAGHSKQQRVSQQQNITLPSINSFSLMKTFFILWDGVWVHFSLLFVFVPGELAVRGDVAGPSALGADGGVGDATGLGALPGPQDPRR